MMNQWQKVLTTIGTVLLACIVLGVASCVREDRRERQACYEAGGGPVTVNMSRAFCGKVTIEPLPIVLKP